MASMPNMLKALDTVPNVPFFTGLIKKTVMEWAKTLGLSENGVNTWSDSLGLYITLKRGRPTQCIFLCSHLDHPGFVFNEHGLGTPLGSVGGVGNRSVPSISIATAMDLYSRKGIFIDTLPVTVRADTIKVNARLPVNTIGMWHLPDTHFASSEVRMRSADNHVATAMILETAAELWKTQEHLNLILVLTSVEEIFQISMTGLCLRGNAGKKLGQEDIFLVVEVMEMEPFGSGHPGYNSGPLIKVNDGEVGYGTSSKQTGNLAEERLLNAAVQFQHQHTVSSGYTDATALSLLTKCPNIATLAIPCVNKHNITSNGEVTTERVSLTDIYTGASILQKAVILEEFIPVRLLSPRLREGNLRDKRSERVKKYRQNRARLAWEFYHPQNPLHWAALAGSRLF